MVDQVVKDERVPDGTGLSQVEPLSAQGLAPPGFDPSRVADLELALGVALDYLIQFEPGDSRGVSNEFVAMAAIYCGHTHRLGECRQILHAARVRSGAAIAMEAREGRDAQRLDGEAATARAEGIAHPGAGQ